MVLTCYWGEACPRRSHLKQSENGFAAIGGGGRADRCGRPALHVIFSSQTSLA